MLDDFKFAALRKIRNYLVGVDHSLIHMTRATVKEFTAVCKPFGNIVREEHYKEYETLINKKKDLQNQIEGLKKSLEESSLNHELNELAEKIENVKLAKKERRDF